MNADKAAQFITREVRVERVDVIAAKSFILRESDNRTYELAKKWAREVAGEPPSALPLYEEDPTPILRQYARYFSAQLAVYQAVWELISVAVLLPAGNVQRKGFNVAWTTCRPPRGSGVSGGFDLPEIELPYLEQFVRSKPAPDTILTDGDLYIKELPSGTLHPGIKEALRLAVACFRQELYVPAVAMLAAASEGAWIELGKALGSRRPHDAKSQKVLATVMDEFEGIGKKVNLIVDLYSRQDLFSDCAKTSGISLNRLREVVLWTHTVREARNVLHWGVSPTPANTYEKVAILLMSALQNLGDLEALRIAATVP